MAQIIVLGLNPSGKVPGVKWNVQFGKGKVSVGSIPRYLLLMGNKVGAAVTVSVEVSNAGTATTNVPYEITPDIDADALFGARSELARMIAIARRYPGVRIKAIAVPEATAGTPAKATATITIATNASSAGTWAYYFGGKRIEASIASGDTPTTQATAIRDAFNAISDLPCTATNSSGVVTIAFAHPGPRGNEATLYQDTSAKPGGSTSTLASASSYTVTAGPGGVTGVRLGDGSAGADVVTTALDALDGQTFFTIACAQIDSTNLGLIKTYNDDKASLGAQRYEHIVFGQNGLLATAQGLTTAINKERWSCAWQQGGENLPGELAASLGALRTQAEQLHPNPRYLGSTLLGIAPQRALADRPSESETGTQQSAMDSGVTPVTTTDDGLAIVPRVITTKHFKTVGATTIDFYGTLDVGDARGIDVFAEELQLAWLTEYGANNPYVDDDPAPGEPNRPTGVATPRTWNGYVTNIAGEKIADNWFSEVSVDSEYDATGKQILTTIQATPTPKNYRIAGNIAQTF